jgi:hypothetical protein
LEALTVWLKVGGVDGAEFGSAARLGEDEDAVVVAGLEGVVVVAALGSWVARKFCLGDCGGKGGGEDSRDNCEMFEEAHLED